MEKHNLYFRMVESFSASGCPLCFFVEDAVEKYFDNILYEGVNDFGFIEKFRKNKGFCNFHTYKLLSYKNAISTASLYFYLFKDILEDLKNVKREKFSLSKHSCQVCDFVNDTEKMYISTFVVFIDEKELKENFVKSYGFCLPHFINFIDYSGKKIPEWFFEFEYEKFEKIFSSLKIYLDSKNVSLKEKKLKLTYEEELIYQKALKFFSGYSGKIK